ncbi:protein of unknown function [Bradyrhizobium vignae]|uniref:Uncharacterized protein n=1 Tax=Bradyrhizobium vignae TaxID=1549949 RepID=A0A2U3PUQ6_9BRAD|nr:protein of unknown function [Bradyrhizobium vignae]
MSWRLAYGVPRLRGPTWAEGGSSALRGRAYSPGREEFLNGSALLAHDETAAAKLKWKDSHRISSAYHSWL